MAEQTTTTKQAAVWNPPRLMKLALGGTKSGTRGAGTGIYEGVNNHLPGVAPPTNSQPSTGYRMPTSGEPVPYPYPWQ